jgi:hypothetical protein
MNAETAEARSYRCYLFSSAKSIIRAKALQCRNDNEAREAALAWFARPDNADGVAFELWRGATCVLVHVPSAGPSIKAE